MSLETEKRIAFVVQRCGPNIHAGAERYVITLAQTVASLGYNIDIYTSQASSARTWKNELPELEVINQASPSEGLVRILRFRATSSRRFLLFRIFKRVSFLLSAYTPVIYRAVSFWLDKGFLWSQGPWCPGLTEALASAAHSYTAVVVKCYLYAPSARALDALAQTNTPSIFVVTAHDEPEFRLQFVGQSLKKASTLAFVSRAEQSLCHKIWPSSSRKPFCLLPPGLDNHLFEALKFSNWPGSTTLPERFCLVLGRVDQNKGLKILYDLIPPNCPIVFAGEIEHPVEPDERFLFIGRVTEEQKKWLLLSTRALLVVSRFEAYSMVTAEAQAVGCPVLALAGCGPVEELVQAFGGAIVSREHFGEAVGHVLEHDAYREKLLPNKELIREQRSWLATAQQLIRFLDEQKGEAVV